MADRKPFVIVNLRTGAQVGEAATLKSARRVVDRRDLAFGGYAHAIRERADGELRARL